MTSTHGRLIARIGREPRSVGLNRRHAADSYPRERLVRDQAGRSSPVANIVHVRVVLEEAIVQYAPVQGYLRSGPGPHAGGIRGGRAHFYMDRVRSSRLRITDLLDGDVRLRDGAVRLGARSCLPISHHVPAG